jgi:hypothetical protein
MQTRDGVQNLGIRDTEDLAEWFVYHLSMEQRAKLMAERPVIYARMYPHTRDAVVEHVRNYIEESS